MVIFKVFHLLADTWAAMTDPETRVNSAFRSPNGQPISVREARRQGLIKPHNSNLKETKRNERKTRQTLQTMTVGPEEIGKIFCLTVDGKKQFMSWKEFSQLPLGQIDGWMVIHDFDLIHLKSK